jgi:hypothetical protein
MSGRHGTSNLGGHWVSGLLVGLGLLGLGYLLGGSLIKFKELDRVVSVKGLAEREMPADIALWPIQFTQAENDLGALYVALEKDREAVTAFLIGHGFQAEDISLSAPIITDKLAQSYGGNAGLEFRYSATQTVTVYSQEIQRVRQATGDLVALGKKGVVLAGNAYDSRTQYLFTSLNDIKPAMIEEATRKAREVAEKFAADSDSRLGKIKRASQGQFSVSDRDSNNPHIKKIRVVTTVEYYLSD